MSSTQWRSYEEVATYLLNSFAKHFDLGFFEGKQVLPGASGTSWEIDAKGVSASDGAFVVVECKRYPKRRINQETVGGLAYRIQDLGASSGIIVTPIEVQEGAAKVAAHANIEIVHLNPEATTTDYVMRFLNQICIGVEEKITLTDSATIEVRDKDGNLIERRHM